uniref:hypothetical protein n=1 Tax=Bacteroides finegoldii TaxID=338188 RepID=UPI003566CB5B
SGSVSVIKVGQVTFTIVGQVTLYFPASGAISRMDEETSGKRKDTIYPVYPQSSLNIGADTALL